MAKKWHKKLDLGDSFRTHEEKTYIRPAAINLTFEDRGNDYKLNYKVTYKQKQASSGKQWSIATTLNALDRIGEDIRRLHKYFYYQLKPLKKGFEIMVVTDESLALIATILGEILAFSIRTKEDSNSLGVLIDQILKWISKANFIDE
ncbi:MAG: hypothetical protein ACTSRS_11065 [Candidatus Helarchaeota archaeon]